MVWRSIAAPVMACCLMTMVESPAAEEAAEPSIQYVPLDAPAGMSQAVIVQRMPLVHTRQLFPFDREGKLVGEGSADQQIEQVLANLEAVLRCWSIASRKPRPNSAVSSNRELDQAGPRPSPLTEYGVVGRLPP